MSLTVSEFVKNQQLANFTRYLDGNLWYEVENLNGNYNLEFPIPIEETKGGVFPSQIKAITLMRWIRSHVELINSGPNEDTTSK